jgi:hypothetical protein
MDNIKYKNLVTNALLNTPKKTVIAHLKKLCDFFESNFFCRFERFTGTERRRVLKGLDAILIKHNELFKNHYKNDGLIDDFNRYMERFEELEKIISQKYFFYLQNDTNAKDEIKTIVTSIRK